MSKIILFIPFTVSENNFSLYMRALSWRSNSKCSEETSDKVPSIVMYRHPEENEEDFEDYAEAQFNFTQENIASDTVIYILADGTGDPNHVINVNQAYYERLSQEPYQLSIDAVAWRIKQCGLTPQLARNLKAINLFICDEDNNNDQLAVFFAQTLGKKYKELTINYYSATVYIPQLILNDGVNAIKKQAYLHIPSNDGTTKLVKAGFAHDHKHALKVSSALTQQKSSLHSTDSRKSKAQPLPTFKELTSATYSVSIEEISDTESIQISLEQQPQSVIVTFPEDELDVGNEVDIATLTLEEPQTESQPEIPTQSTAIVRQNRSIIPFFKYVNESDKKDMTPLLHDLSSCNFI